MVSAFSSNSSMNRFARIGERGDPIAICKDAEILEVNKNLLAIDKKNCLCHLDIHIANE